jgi:hypothetical protein
VSAPDPRRLKAWKTRKEKYGPAGHVGPYRTGSVDSDLSRRALEFVLSLYEQAVLSEGQCCKALGLDRVSFRALVQRDGAAP